jgi:hypothetical protein
MPRTRGCNAPGQSNATAMTNRTLAANIRSSAASYRVANCMGNPPVARHPMKSSLDGTKDEIMSAVVSRIRTGHTRYILKIHRYSVTKIAQSPTNASEMRPCHKKEPQAVYRLGAPEVLPQLRLLNRAAGVSGDGEPRGSRPYSRCVSGLYCRNTHHALVCAVGRRRAPQMARLTHKRHEALVKG